MAPLLGQEAAQIGSARALREDDFIFPSYRETGVAYCRGVDMLEVLRLWRGAALCGWDSTKFGMGTAQIVIGAQALHAAGYALGTKLDGSDAATITYFGDGATSQGDVNEAFVFPPASRSRSCSSARTTTGPSPNRSGCRPTLRWPAGPPDSASPP